MDPRKAYGVAQAVGRALAASEGGLERLRACATRDDFERWIETVSIPVPPSLVAEWVASIPPEEWPKARAKLILALQLARGAIEAGKGHEAGRGARPGR